MSEKFWFYLLSVWRIKEPKFGNFGHQTSIFSTKNEFYEKRLCLSPITSKIPSYAIYWTYVSKNRKLICKIPIFLEDEVTFAPTKLRLNGRLGVTKLLIEWNDYQNECFGQLIYQHKQKDSSSDEHANKEKLISSIWEAPLFFMKCSTSS